MVKTLTKAMLAQHIEEQVGLDSQDAKRVIEIFFTTIINALSEGQTVKLTSLGTWKVRRAKACLARNLLTGERLAIESKSKVAFISSQILKKGLKKLCDRT